MGYLCGHRDTPAILPYTSYKVSKLYNQKWISVKKNQLSLARASTKDYRTVCTLVYVEQLYKSNSIFIICELSYVLYIVKLDLRIIRMKK